MCELIVEVMSLCVIMSGVTYIHRKQRMTETQAGYTEAQQGLSTKLLLI